MEHNVRRDRSGYQAQAGEKSRYSGERDCLLISITSSKAINAYIDQLDSNLSPNSKEGRLARRLKARWSLSHNDWSALEELREILEVGFAITQPHQLCSYVQQVFNAITLEFSETSIPSICRLLPLYKASEATLKKYIAHYDRYGDPYKFLPALKDALAKQKKYIDRAVKSKFVLIGTGKSFGSCFRY